MSAVYNLQAKISKEAEQKYRILSKKDKRKISNFAKLILEMLVEDMDILDESTHKLHIEKLAMYNNILSTTSSDIDVITSTIKKEEVKKEEQVVVSECKETLENQSTTQQEKKQTNIIKNSMFAGK